jgi:hypothetical protein
VVLCVIHQNRQNALDSTRSFYRCYVSITITKVIREELINVESALKGKDSDTAGLEGRIPW